MSRIIKIWKGVSGVFTLCNWSVIIHKSRSEGIHVDFRDASFA
jgi:hypothetical protein